MEEEFSLEAKILACKTIIKYDLIPREVLDDLESFLDQEAFEEIEKFENKQWIKASEQLLRSLERKNVPGWGRAFMETLEKKKYRKLIGIINQNNQKEQEKLAKALEIYRQSVTRNFNEFFSRQLDIQQLLLILMPLETLSEEDAENISAHIANHRLIAANRELFRCVYRKSLTWFPDLLWALNETGKYDIFCMLIGINDDDEAGKDKWRSYTLDDLRNKLCAESIPEYLVHKEENADVLEERFYHLFIAETEEAQEMAEFPTDHWDGPDPMSNVPAETNIPHIKPFNIPNRSTGIHSVTAATMVHQDHGESTSGSGVHVSTSQSSSNSASQTSCPSRNYLLEHCEGTGMASRSDSPLRKIPKIDIRSSERQDEGRSEPVPEPEPKSLDLRSYQLELAEPALLGKNTIIVAPTGSGKTHVALWIVKKHFESLETSGEQKPRVAFLVPTVSLVDQQARQFKTYLEHTGKKCKGLSGEHAAQAKKSPFGTLCLENDIIVTTPQLMVNGIGRDKELKSFSEFTMIIFDECHHMTGGHPYKELARMYLKEKYVDDEQSGSSSENPESSLSLPQIIGLTASLGVGKGNSKAQAVTHILELCGSMAADKVQTVTVNTEELSNYKTTPVEEVHLIKSNVGNPFAQKMRKTMNSIEEMLKKTVEGCEVLEKEKLLKLMKPPQEWRSDTYTQWVHGLENGINMVKDDHAARMIYALKEELQMYNDTLFFNDYCRSCDALEYLVARKENEIKRRESRHEDFMDKSLRKLYETLRDDLQKFCQESQELKGMLLKLKEVMLTHEEKFEKEGNESSGLRGIIFCKTRELARALNRWMSEDSQLKHLNPHYFTSTNASADDAGLTVEGQNTVLNNFHNGIHKILIATTVAEEGLDITECNLVIRYNHITNETARVQAQGRARAKKAYYVLIGEGDVVEKEEVLRQREQLMQKALQEIHSIEPSDFKSKVLQNSKDIVRQPTSRRIVPKRVYAGIKLKCKKCRTHACCPEDLRVIKNIHHVVISEEFQYVSKIERIPKPKYYDEFANIGNLLCDQCSNVWGIEQRYQEVNYRVIKIAAFRVENADGQFSTYKKWADVPFAISELLPEDQDYMAALQEEAIAREVEQNAMTD